MSPAQLLHLAKDQAFRGVRELLKVAHGYDDIHASAAAWEVVKALTSAEFIADASRPEP